MLIRLRNLFYDKIISKWAMGGVKLDFSSHLLALKPILTMATNEDLVLLDEIAVGTEPKIGIAQTVLEQLNEKGITTLVTTRTKTKNTRNKQQKYA